MPNRPRTSARVPAKTPICASLPAALFPSSCFTRIKVDPIEHGSTNPTSPRPIGSKIALVRADAVIGGARCPTRISASPPQRTHGARRRISSEEEILDQRRRQKNENYQDEQPDCAHSPHHAAAAHHVVHGYFLVRAERIRSALVRYEMVDLLGTGENHVGTVAHHAGIHQRGRPLRGTLLAGIGLEPEVPFPEIARLSVSRRHPIRIATIADSLHAILGIELLEIRNGCAAHHAAHAAHSGHSPHLSSLGGGAPRLRRLLQERQQVGALPALRFHTSARLGPVMLRLGSSAWQATQAPNARWPRPASPFTAQAGNAKIIMQNMASAVVCNR